MFNMSIPNKDSFDKLCKEVEDGTHGPLALKDLGRIFGEEFWELIIVAMIGVEIKADNIEIKIK